MYLVQTDNRSEIANIASDLDALNDFQHCDLGELNTLTLMEICPESANWITKEPEVFNEGSGIAIFEVDIAAKSWLLQNADVLINFGADAGAVLAFAKHTGPMFAVDTF